MFVIPVKGGVVRDPRTKRIVPAEGLEVPDSDFYWHRRLAHGDVTLRETSAAPDPAPIADELHDG
jgi:hypothetical protein